MNCLTLNTHSWMEANALKKLFDLAEHILSENYDVICLQEINQLIDSEIATKTDRYQAVSGTPPIHWDNFALLLVNYLEKHGRKYYWSWAYNHIGYDIYHEGVAILSKEPFTAREILISYTDNPNDYHTRRALVIDTVIDDKAVTIVNLHMSWFGKGFEHEWAKLEEGLKQVDNPLILMGDFNNPTNQEGYQLILNSSLALKDSHQIADTVYGDHTIAANIDGWENNHQELKVDHIFVSDGITVKSSEVVFDDGAEPIVSDHYGVKAMLEI